MWWQRSRWKRPAIGTRGLIALGVIGLALAGASCGYSLAGRGTFLPEHIETIAVPTFENETPYFDLEQLFSEKIRSELIGRGRYKVVPDQTGADAVLIGQITNLDVAPVSFTSDQQASRYVTTVTASIALRDLMDDSVVWENSRMSYREEFDAASGSNALDPVAFFGQSTNAMQRLSTEFAKAVVSSILEAF